MNTLLIFFAGYLAVSVAINVLAIGYRKDLAAAVQKAKRIDGLSKQEIATLDSYVLSMRSLRTSIILLLVFWQLALMPKEQLAAGPTRVMNDALWESGLMSEILEKHMASAAAANPLFGALAYAMRSLVHYRFKRLCGDDGEQRELRSFSARYAAG